MAWELNDYTYLLRNASIRDFVLEIHMDKFTQFVRK